MSEDLILAIPSKGRLKEQVEHWLADAGLPVTNAGGGRGYSARMDGIAGVSVRLLSASDIAAALYEGEVHLGVTGEDLLREFGETLDARVMLLRALGFGRADLVVAAPKSWVDVESMADLDDVAHLYLARTGRRMRVATKYLAQTRSFFARHGVADYRIVESSGATEGAPAAGAAEIVVDITSSGATLQANSLKIIGDGLILKSQAQLAGSLAATWDAGQIETLRRLMAIVEARARGKTICSLVWPAEQEPAARAAIQPFTQPDQATRANGVLVDARDLFAASQALAAAGVGPVSVSHPAYVFEPTSPVAESLAAIVGG
ncbi:ATP phosphoribosyltransferase [Caulobacter sp. KR2-114]|uniref:ATP phosphoribosyltransferase n=1 Tax=Caulobacter sp. KR2-114 TaxID=3400912 RepID=UPI003BFAEBDD